VTFYFDVQQPKVTPKGRTIVLQGPVSPSVDIIRVNTEEIPKERFFSNNGLRWYTEQPVGVGENIFDIRAGTLQPSNTGSLTSYDSDCYACLTDAGPLHSGNIDAYMGAGGSWVTLDNEDLVGFRWTTGPFSLDATGVVPTGVYYRYTFDLPAGVNVLSANLILGHNNGMQAYLNGTSVYVSDMPGSGVGWTYADPAPINESYNVHQSGVSPSHFVEGINTLAIVQKRFNSSSNVIFTGYLTAVIQPTWWTEPKRVSFQLVDVPIQPFNNFNDLDEWGTLLSVERLPGERNPHYKRRLINYIGRGFGPNIQGVMNGASSRLNMPVADAGIHVLFNKSSFSREDQPILDRAIVTVFEGQLSVVSDRIINTESPTLRAGYNRLEPSGNLYTINKVIGASQGLLNPWEFQIRDDDNIYILREADQMGYSIEYVPLFQYEFRGHNILDVATWLNRITMSGMDASGLPTEVYPFNATPDPTLVFLAYSGQVTESGLIHGSGSVVSSGSVEPFETDTGLYFHRAGEIEYYAVQRVYDHTIYLDETYQGPTPSGSGFASFELLKAPEAEYIPDAGIQVESQGADMWFDLPVYQLKFRPVTNAQWEDYLTGSGDVMAQVKQVRDSIRESWQEIVTDGDTWDPLASRQAGGALVPAIYDPPAPAFGSGDYQAGVDSLSDLELLEISEQPLASGLTTIQLSIGELWRDTSLSTKSIDLGYYHKFPFGKHISLWNAPTGEMTIVQDKTFAFYARVKDVDTTGELYGKQPHNLDMLTHFIGIKANAEHAEMLELGIAAADPDAIRRGVILPAWNNGDIIMDDFRGWDDYFLLVRENGDVISQGPTLVLKVENV
jgi:hypothetical protein